MLVTRLACLRSLPAFGLRSALTQASPTLRNSVLKTSPPLLQLNQGYATKARFGFRHGKTVKEGIKEAALKPAMETAIKFDNMGRVVLAGGAVVGLGALCYYGLGMSNEIGAIEKAVIWPQYVKDRIHSTYMYFAGSVGMTALSAVAVSRSPMLMNLMMRGSWLAIGATFAAMIGAGMLVRSISYDQSPGPKHLAWMLYAVDNMGRVVLAGGAVVGLGALCYYGLGMSNEIGAIEKAVIWPQYVKDRIHSTYMYFAGSVGMTALSAVAVSRSPMLMNLMMRGSWLAIGATFAAMIGAGMLVRSISYDQSPGPKHLAWMLYAGTFLDYLGMIIWPQYVKDRIHSTYMYFAGSVGMTALSAVAVSRSPMLMNLMMRGSWLAIGATFAAMIGAGMLVRSISYDQSPGPKHLAWMLYAGVMGAVVAPVTLLGGPLLIRAAWYTAGIVGGLSTVAMCAPSEKFLSMGGPLAVGLGLVFASSIGSMFLPPTSAFGAGLYSVAIYGGLILFGMFLLYDTQKVIKRAESYPVYGVQKYDPINSVVARQKKMGFN
ncbi:UNVERIFIED_CONTAM: hypothetical protein FKN15_012065 [Acipenser sinensis]